MDVVRTPYLIEEVSQELDWSKSDVRTCITTFFQIIADELAEGNEVAVSPYVTFKFTSKAAVKKGTMVRNPFSGESQPSEGRPASVGIRARAGAGLKKGLPAGNSKIGKEIIASKKKAA